MKNPRVFIGAALMAALIGCAGNASEGPSEREIAASIAAISACHDWLKSPVSHLVGHSLKINEKDGYQARLVTVVGIGGRYLLTIDAITKTFNRMGELASLTDQGDVVLNCSLRHVSSIKVEEGEVVSIYYEQGERLLTEEDVRMGLQAYAEANALNLDDPVANFEVYLRQEATRLSQWKLE